MDKALYVAMSGAKQTMLAQAVHSNNLANATTIGFAADLEQARAMPVFGEGLPSRVYAMTERAATDFSVSALVTTDNPLDVAVSGDGFLVVLDEKGQEAYTRDGQLRVDEFGRLKNGRNLDVVGQGGPIALPPAEKMDINPDGTISYIPLGDTTGQSQILDRLQLVKADLKQMVKGEDGLFRPKNRVPLEPDASISLTPGALNASNVNAVEEMVNIISLARQFEMQINLMHKTEENDQKTSEIMRMG